MTNDITNVTRLTSLFSSDTTLHRNEQGNGKIALAAEAGRSGSIHTLNIPGKKTPEDENRQEVSPDELKTAVDKGNALFQAVQRNLQIEVDDSTHKVVVKVVDRASGDVIRQMPSKEVLNFLKQMQEQEGGSGSFIKGRA